MDVVKGLASSVGWLWIPAAELAQPERGTLILAARPDPAA